MFGLFALSDEIGNFDPNFTNCQDDDICLRLAKKYRFGLIKENLAIIKESDNQVSHNLLDYANGWWKLYHKFRTDILLHCGRKTMGKHMKQCFRLYLDARSLPGCFRSALAAVWYDPGAIFTITGLSMRLLLRRGRRLFFAAEGGQGAF